jgi:hypothetical protein
MAKAQSDVAGLNSNVSPLRDPRERTAEALDLQSDLERQLALRRGLESELQRERDKRLQLEGELQRATRMIDSLMTQVEKARNRRRPRRGRVR